jgi:epoxyqueuosine reductase
MKESAMSLPAPEALTAVVLHHAHQLGFSSCRIIPMAEAPHAEFYAAWLAAGRAGEMEYLHAHLDKRRWPAHLAEGQAPFQSMIVLAIDYHQFDLPPAVRDDPSRGIIAAYAWGDDYHEVVRPRLYALDEALRAHSGRQSPGKCLVDTGPVLERDWAQRAGLGFTGKNCCTIHPEAGSWLLLATLLVPERLVYSPAPVIHGPPAPAADVLAGLPPATVHATWEFPRAAGRRQQATCGRCTRCLDACPTAAFVGPYHLDPLRCISYWTIEAKAPIPRALRPHFGNRIFGCDICQEVCPYNRRLPARQPLLPELHAHANRIAPPLLEGFTAEHPYWLDQAAFSEHFRRSPVKRAKRYGMLRNVCVALGNWAAPETVPALEQALIDPHPLPRQHAAWALGRVLARHRASHTEIPFLFAAHSIAPGAAAYAAAEQAAAALEHALITETDPTVLEEIHLAI